MNLRNVDALEDLLMEWLKALPPGGLASTGAIAGLAEWLAARGVLAPQALTAADSIDAGEWPIERQIAALERIARGDP